ncbi:hypothetical protein PHMEG_00039332, partial [Phytophthora megakarya]
HLPKQIDEWRKHSRLSKRVYCDGCFNSNPVYLCMKPRQNIDGVMMSCWDVLHSTYKNGTAGPDHLQSKIRLRQSPAKRRRIASLASAEEAEMKEG